MDLFEKSISEKYNVVYEFNDTIIFYINNPVVYYKLNYSDIKPEIEIINRLKIIYKNLYFPFLDSVKFVTIDGYECIEMRKVKTLYETQQIFNSNPEKYILEIFKNLNLLHQNDIYHNDIKPENIFYDDIYDQYFLWDFGLSYIKKLDKLDYFDINRHFTLNHDIVSHEYRAPEVRKHGDRFIKNDIFIKRISEDNKWAYKSHITIYSDSYSLAMSLLVVEKNVKNDIMELLIGMADEYLDKRLYFNNYLFKNMIKLNLSILTWNVNGIRKNILKSSDKTLDLKKVKIDDFDTSVGIGRILLSESVDIICFQETKCNSEILSKNINIPGWKHHFQHNLDPNSNSKCPDVYSGVGIMWRDRLGDPVKVIDIIHDNDQGRVITLIFDKFTITSLYSPHGSRKNKEYREKIFYPDFLKHIDSLPELPHIICGDINNVDTIYDMNSTKNDHENGMSEKEIDDKWTKKTISYFRPEERKFFNSIKDRSFIDSWKFLNKNSKWDGYTYEDYKCDLKLRIDYCLCKDAIINKCYTLPYDRSCSDHIPLLTHLTI